MVIVRNFVSIKPVEREPILYRFQIHLCLVEFGQLFFFTQYFYWTRQSWFESTEIICVVRFFFVIFWLSVRARVSGKRGVID